MMIKKVTQVAKLAFGVPDFCEAHGISRSLFYELLQSSEGPEIMKVNNRTLISVEAAAAWRKRMTEKTSNPIEAA